METTVSSIWWKQVTGPVGLTEHIARELVNDHSIIFVTPQDLPWRHEMRYSVEDLIQGEGLTVDTIDCKDDCSGADIDRFLLDRFGTKNDITEYRPHRETIGQYMQNRCILKNKVIWVKGIPDDKAEGWLTFYRDYRGKTRDHGLFVIEMHSNTSKLQFSNHTDIVDYFNYISKYDTHLFASIVVSQSDAPKYLHKYITAAVSNICGTDAEIAADMIKTIDFTTADPIDGLKELFKNNYSMTGRGCTNNMGEAHPFYLIRTENMENLFRRLWSAQLQVAFPAIEEGRIEFIKKYEPEIRSCLPVKQFEMIISEPYDVELGTLAYLASSKREEMGLKRLYIPVVSDYNRLQFLHNVRNKLAHVIICTPEEMTQLLKMTAI